MDGYFKGIFRLFLYLILADFLNPLTFARTMGSDVTKRAALLLLKAGSN